MHTFLPTSFMLLQFPPLPVVNYFMLFTIWKGNTIKEKRIIKTEQKTKSHHESLQSEYF